MSALPISSDDLKLLAIGALSAVIAAGVIYTISNVLKKRVKLQWTKFSRYLELQLPNKKNSETVHFNEIILENVGRGTAKEVLVKMPKTTSKFEIELQKTYWWTTSYIGTRNSEIDLDRREDGDSTISTIRNLRPNRLISISFITTTNSSSKPTSVIVDGDVIEPQYAMSRYRRGLEAYQTIIAFLVALLVLGWIRNYL